MTLRVLVVDDEALGRRGVLARLARRNDVEVADECATGREAIAAIRRHKPDLVFLDVQMPGVDGFEVLRRLEPAERPHVIFVTAFDRHAVRAFEVHALDYLLKPIDDERFTEAVDRVAAMHARHRESGIARRLAVLLDEAAPPRYAVRLKNRTLFVPPAEIDWVAAEGDYVRVHAGTRNWLIRDTMAAVERDLGATRFVRVHRSAIVNVDRVQELRSLEGGDCAVVLRDGTELRLGRTYREAVERLLVT
ncbi:MAG: two component transcriptional regulator, LytTR family [Acidobacteria bacterium]|nr:two component transcriptional regulator, LytTR family [Acidobacteriota bacterium]